MLKPVVDNHTLLQQSISKVCSKIEELNSQYSDLKVKIDHLSENMDCSEGATTNLHQGITSDSIASIVVTLANEEKEKEKRQFNLILHNIKESDDTDSSRRKKEGVCAAISIFKDYLDVTVSITNCF